MQKDSYIALDKTGKVKSIAILEELVNNGYDPAVKFVLLNSDGISIIEAVASLLIITLILISFFSLIVQANKTGKASEQIIDATYVGQVEMEKIYEFKNIAKISTLEADFGTNLAYMPIPIESSPPDIFVYEKVDGDFKIKITMKKANLIPPILSKIVAATPPCKILNAVLPINSFCIST